MTRTVVAFVSDTHAGHDAGLTNPDAELVDLDTGTARPPHMNERRKWLWEHYRADVADIVAWANGAPIVLAHLGDATHGNLRPDNVTEQPMHHQLTLAAANFEPWRAGNLQALYFVAGTSWHEFGTGSGAALLSEWLKARYRLPAQALYHAILTVEGVEFELAHHGPPPGSRKHLRGNILRIHARDRMWLDLEHGRSPPRVYVWGHYHTLTLETVSVPWAARVYESTALIMPPYCLPGAYAVQQAQSPAYVGVGLTAFTVDGGEIVGRRLYPHVLDLRRRT